jgi:cobalt-zinc-cadmium efflux system membrane fusion protein
MILANHDQVWMELSVFSQDATLIKPGQTVRVRQDHVNAEGQISYTTPAQGEAPYLIARIPLDNGNRQWTPGTFAEAEVIVGTVKAPLLVDNRALQSFRDWQVVFIQVGDTYEIRPLVLGRSDGRFTEVVEGLQTGDRYVVENSYLLKADLEKSGASHDH